MPGSDASRAARNIVPSQQPRVGLARSLTLVHAVLYGLGVTIGAGIYVLVGPAIGRAGDWAPLAFALAAVLMSLTAASFAELGSRMPVAAGEAAYVRAGFRSDRLATVAGLIVVAIAIISAAAISVGSAGYIGAVLALPQNVIVAGVIVAMGSVAAWGIKESVTFAGVMTVIEIGGLVVIVVAGSLFTPLVPLTAAMPETPGFSSFAMAGLVSTTLLAVFAFIGFEGLANIAEEMDRPQRDLPWAIFITLLVTTILYMAVVWVALRTSTPSELAASTAPLTIVFERTTGADPRIMTAIAIIATINGIIVQIILSARVLYGLAGQGGLHSAFGHVHPTTQTPLIATAFTVAAVLALALLLPLDRLADWTSRLTLVLFALVNAALAAIKWREPIPPPGLFSVPVWVPWAGIVSSVGVLVADLLMRS